MIAAGSAFTQCLRSKGKSLLPPFHHPETERIDVLELPNGHLPCGLSAPEFIMLARRVPPVTREFGDEVMLPGLPASTAEKADVCPHIPPAPRPTYSTAGACTESVASIRYYRGCTRDWSRSEPVTHRPPDGLATGVRASARNDCLERSEPAGYPFRPAPIRALREPQARKQG